MERILVLDDDTAIRESLMLYLEDSELDAVSAASSDEALKLLMDYPCDVAIVDLRLPGKTGEEFILDAYPSYPQMNFIIHTGSSDYQITPRLLEIGLREQHIFIKPVANLQQLIDAVVELRTSTR